MAGRHIAGDPTVYFYDGQRLLGLIFDRAAGTVATDHERQVIGTFANRREAARAIFEHHQGIEQRSAA